MNASLSTFDPDDAAGVDGDARTSLVAQLVGSDAGLRREALRVARARRWLDPYGEIVVRAVAVDGHPSPHREFAQALTVSGRGHTLAVEDGDMLLLVTSTGRTDLDIGEWARKAAARVGVPIAGPIGSAALHAEEDDLRRAADDARATTELLMLVGGEALGTTRAEDLGMWRLLHGMSSSPEVVAAASPAADELWRAPDQMRRITVEAYLDAGCSVAVACRALFIHRTTLYYRLESMSDVVRDALADGLQRSTLHLGLKLLRLWGGTERSDAASAPRPARGSATITPIRPRQTSKRTPHPVP